MQKKENLKLQHELLRVALWEQAWKGIIVMFGVNRIRLSVSRIRFSKCVQDTLFFSLRTNGSQEGPWVRERWVF